MAHSSRFNQPARLAALLLVLTLLLAACGGNNADEGDDSSQADPQGVTSVAPDATGIASTTEATATPATSATGDMTSEAPSTGEEPAEPVPALGSIDSWHNSESLTLDALRGSPVLLVFWADF